MKKQTCLFIGVILFILVGYIAINDIKAFNFKNAENAFTQYRQDQLLIGQTACLDYFKKIQPSAIR